MIELGKNMVFNVKERKNERFIMLVGDLNNITGPKFFFYKTTKLNVLLIFPTYFILILFWKYSYKVHAFVFHL